MILRRRVPVRAATTCLIASVVLLGMVACSDGSGGDRTRPSSHPSTARAAVGARSLPARWWSWVESVPVGRNPVADPTGADCALGQPADVWFLAGTYGGAARRSCTIPFGRKVYAPVINLICTVPSGQGAAVALRSCTSTVDTAVATLDGAPLRPEEATSRAAFRIVSRAGSRTGLGAGPHDAVAWGVWIGPLALTVGAHTLSFAGTAGSFATSVVYRLTVVARPGSDS